MGQVDLLVPLQIVIPVEALGARVAFEGPILLPMGVVRVVWVRQGVGRVRSDGWHPTTAHHGQRHARLMYVLSTAPAAAP